MAGVSPGTIFTVPELVSMKPTDILEDTHPIASVCTLGMLVNVRPVENRAALEFDGKSIDLDTSLLPVERVLADHFVVIVGELFLERSKPAEETGQDLVLRGRTIRNADSANPSLFLEALRYRRKFLDEL